MGIWLSELGGSGGVLADGSVALTADWNAGAFTITAKGFDAQNGTTATTSLFYKTRTDASNYERLSITGDGITIETAGTGAANKDLVLAAKGTGRIKTDSQVEVTAAFFLKDLTGNPGVSLFDDASGQLNFALFSTATPSVSIKPGVAGNLAGVNGVVLGWHSGAGTDTSLDTGFSRGAANTVFLGNGTNGDFTGTLAGGNAVFGASSLTASAKLEVSSTTLGFLPPRMTTTQRDAIGTPAAGLVIYNTTTNVLNFHNGTSWGAV